MGAFDHPAPRPLPHLFGLGFFAPGPDVGRVAVRGHRYSPNLNLMECFWKYLRPKIINTTFYRTKGQFRTAVLDFFHRLPEFGQDLASSLTRKFHILDAQPTS